MLSSELSGTWEAAVHGIVNADVLVEFFPAQSQSLETKLHLFKLRRVSLGEQGVFGHWKADQTLISQFQSDAPTLGPAPESRDG